VPTKSTTKTKTASRKPKLQTLSFKQTIADTPVEVSRMFTHETALRDWLCDRASVEAAPNGIIQLRWETGEQVNGQFVTYELGSKLAFTWNATRLPASIRVAVTFKPQGDSTLVTLAVSGIGSGKAWAGVADKEMMFWQSGLENLKSVMGAGIDLRIARRPRLGIGFDKFTPEAAEKIGVPVKAGIWITGTAEGSGAEAAGLIKDDVLVNFNGKTLTSSMDSLGAGLEGCSAGDTVQIEWYRGKEKMKGPLTLGKFSVPPIPNTAVELANSLRDLYAGLNKEWEGLVDGLSESQADHKEGSEWSVKEIIAHFIACERDYQSWLSSMVRDNAIYDDVEMRPTIEVRLQAIVGRFKTLKALLEERQAAGAETVAFIANFPEAFVKRKHLFRRAAQLHLDFVTGHFYEEHLEQIKIAIAAAKK
jgi:uncharacterized protein YndB with AHSA1/START domain